jgi:cell division septation protein DedD
VGIEPIGPATVQTREPNGFYVLIPAAASRAEALATADRLKRKGFKDSWVFASGPLKHAISLGMFSRRENAGRRLKALRAKGFEAQIYPRFKTSAQTVLRVRGPGGGAAERQLERLVAGRKKRIDCPD